ncbi:hypothetical protein [Simiduia litorea]
MPETALTLEAHLWRLMGIKFGGIDGADVEQGEMPLNLAHIA